MFSISRALANLCDPVDAFCRGEGLYGTSQVFHSHTSSTELFAIAVKSSAAWRQFSALSTSSDPRHDREQFVDPVSDCQRSWLRSIRTIRTSLRCFGTSKAPANGVGSPRELKTAGCKCGIGVHCGVSVGVRPLHVTSNRLRCQGVAKTYLSTFA